MICCLGADFADSHYLITIDADWVFESIAIPKLEQGHVKADMGWIQGFVTYYFFEEAC